MGAKRPESLLSKYNQTHISIQIEVFNTKNDKSSPALLWKLGLLMALYCYEWVLLMDR